MVLRGTGEQGARWKSGAVRRDHVVMALPLALALALALAVGCAGSGGNGDQACTPHSAKAPPGENHRVVSSP